MVMKVITILLVLEAVLLTYAREVQSPPRFVKQPPTDEVLFQVGVEENDKPFFIECEAAGEPAPTYRWVKNGKKFDWRAYDDRISQQTGRGTLTIAKPKDVDIGQYQCFAENEFGVATSNSVFMRKAELNSFKVTQPVSLTGNEGDPYKLSCQPPDGWPKPKVYWVIQYTGVNGGFKTINNSRMSLDPEGNLWFSNLTRQDASDNFMYACAAASNTKLEYKLGNQVLLNVLKTSASSVSLNKHEPVKQYTSRKDEVALRGKNVELFCIYGGTPLPQIVWSKDAHYIKSSDRITQGNYGKSLIIKLVDFDDEGVYRCDVSNGVGEATSYSIDLKVLAVPYFTEEPEIITAAEGETIEFRCAASGVPKPEIKWVHNGLPIGKASPNHRRKVNMNSIVIENIIKNDTGNYGCNATNSLGYVYKDVYLNVLALAPEITEAPFDQAATDGQSINMTCKVFGAPKPSVKWIHTDKELTGGRYTVLDSGDLQIKDVQFDDSGSYTCYAENKFGTANASATFAVKAHTYISDGPEDYEVAAGTQATFRCKAVADPSLKLSILWYHQGYPIDFEDTARFVKFDYSMTITKTIELDSGRYTCEARTELDSASAQAELIVQDVPNAPKMVSIQCHKKDATISWMANGDNRAPILRYTIQYNTSFTPDAWEVAYDRVPAADSTYNVPMSPWANYTFRVIAWNKIGNSNPSSHSDVCTTQAEVPHKNPDNVVGEGNLPNNLVIKWTKMPEIEHNAPQFEYKVYWKRDIPGEQFTPEVVKDWRQEELVIPDQPPFTQYRIKVVAKNELGDANVSPKEVIGYSGEDQPLQAPTNFTLVVVQSATTALLSWNPVPLESVRGHFKGYKIKTWAENRFGHREVQVQGDAKKALVTNFVPHSRNFAQVYVYNGKYNGPPSEILSFETPEGKPEQITYLEAYPLGSTGFLLTWHKPEQPNGVILGYKISYAALDSKRLGTEEDRLPEIKNGDQLRAKISGLIANTKYRIYITSYTKAGDSNRHFIERTTREASPFRPGKPQFTIERLSNEGSLVSVKITWLPDLDRPGSHFFVKYKKRGETEETKSPSELVEDYTKIEGLDPNESYIFTVVSVDEPHYTESDSKEFETYVAEGPIIQPRENVATAGWFIGMMLAIAFLLIVLIIVCIVKRNRGGKYAVQEREQANGRRDYPDEGGFHEYSQPLDNKSHGRASMSSDPKLPESDTDSMAEYGEGDTGRFTEDGSFIGQYVPSNMKQIGPAPAVVGSNTNAMATYV